MSDTPWPTRTYWILWIWLATLAAGTPVASATPEHESGGTSESAQLFGDWFAGQNPEFASWVQKVDGVYQSTQGYQGFFLACGGVGSPSFGCGLASDFYDQLADRFDLPQQEVRDPAQFRAPAAAQLDQYKNLLDDFKIKERVCVSVNLGFKTIKKCITVSYPGSLDHFLDKVPDFPGTSQLKKKVRRAFNKAKSEYESQASGFEAQINKLSDLVHRLDQVQQAIDDENKKVEQKAIQLASMRLSQAIEPALEPILQQVAEVTAAYVSKLDHSYLRKQLEAALSLARGGWTRTQFSPAYESAQASVKQQIQAGADPLEVMPDDIQAVVYQVMVTCVENPSALEAKSCIQEQFATGNLALSEDLAQSIYTHTSRRLLYEPCSSQIADDVTTEAAADTFGISCVAYKTLQQTIEELAQTAGNDLYSNTVAPLVKAFVESRLRQTAEGTSKDVVSPIPLPAFHFPGQINAPVRVKTCEPSNSRIPLKDGTCIVPLQKSYIYTWFDANLSCGLEYGSPLCSKDQVAEGQQKGYSWCADSWTSTQVPNAGKARYRVTPMSVAADGCPPIGLNAAVFLPEAQFSGLCCVPIAE